MSDTNGRLAKPRCFLYSIRRSIGERAVVTAMRSSRRLPSLLQNTLRAFELAAAARGQTSAATVDEVLNHPNGRPQPLRRDICPRHGAGDLRCRSREGPRRRMRRIGLDLSDPATLWTLLRHGMDSCSVARHPR